MCYFSEGIRIAMFKETCTEKYFNITAYFLRGFSGEKKLQIGMLFCFFLPRCFTPNETSFSKGVGATKYRCSKKKMSLNI